MTIATAQLVLAASLVACVVPAQSAYPTQPGATPIASEGGARARQITINGAVPNASEAQTLAQLEAAYATTLSDGAYWYDATSGAVGVWGQPTGAVIQAGLDLGPAVPANASSGDSSVFVNGRELQRSEVQYLSSLLGSPLQPGSYFIDAQGNAGVQGGPVLVNLVQAASARRQGGSANSSSNAGSAGGGGTHMHAGYGSNQSWFDSDGKGCKMFMTSSGSTISSGC